MIRRSTRRRYPRDEKPGIEPARVARRRHPVGKRHELVERKPQLFATEHVAQGRHMIMNLGAVALEPRVGRFTAERNRAAVARSGQQDPCFFEQLARGGHVIRGRLVGA